MNFKYDLPENCPECLDNDFDRLENVDVYRLSKSKKCILSEHQPSVFNKNHFCAKKKNSLINNCQCHGLSVELEIKGLIEKSKRYKKLGNYIFYAKITKEDGILYLTSKKKSPKHCTFFIAKNREECEIFVLYKELRRSSELY